jgi:hypothetical protein
LDIGSSDKKEKWIKKKTEKMTPPQNQTPPSKLNPTPYSIRLMEGDDGG